MSTATLVSKIMEVKGDGGFLQMWTATITTAAITTAGQAVEAVVIPGALSGDRVFVNAGSSLIGLEVASAKVTATDVVSVYMKSNAWVSTLATSTQLLDILILKRSKGLDTTSA